MIVGDAGAASMTVPRFVRGDLHNVGPFLFHRPVCVVMLHSNCIGVGH